MSGNNGFDFPEFWEYPPYYTVQPVAETFHKQKELWCGLILRYCKHTRTFIIDVHDEDLALFRNKKIDRTYIVLCACIVLAQLICGLDVGHLDRGEKRVFLDALVEDGKAIWVDKKDTCLILWKSVDEWADSVYSWCKNMAESVILVDDLCGHDGEMQGSDISGLPMALVVPVIACLEKSGRAKKFKSKTGEAGLKIF
ncbi:Vacuolar protein sorting-associated protein 25 [Picochlorum sp. SENEW3]|nr:Vacuolar protein sorting-associated protein 25 [Picochlorum sp. SENEW3]